MDRMRGPMLVTLRAGSCVHQPKEDGMSEAPDKNVRKSKK